MIVNDIPDSALNVKICAIDTETDTRDGYGLNHRMSKPLCIQYASSEGEYLVPLTGSMPQNMTRLLESSAIKKVFHFAPFDMRFIYFNTMVMPQNVECTKILADCVDPTKQLYHSHSLQTLLDIELGIKLDKNPDIRLSDWSILTDVQVTYAMKDVRYLIELYDRLFSKLSATGLARYNQAMYYIQKQVEIDCTQYDLDELYHYRRN